MSDPFETASSRPLSALAIAATAGVARAFQGRIAQALSALLLTLLFLIIYVAAVELRPGIDWRWRRLSDAEVYVPWTAPVVFGLLCVGAFACFRLARAAVTSRRS